MSKTTIFSSIRQDLCRRLLNTSRLEEIEVFKEVVENYIQILVNSGHQFSFIKAAVLQALTRFKYMEERSRLLRTNPKYRPLYRSRMYNKHSRMILKRIQISTWFNGENLVDPWRHDWKEKSEKKSPRIRKRKKEWQQGM